VSDWQSIKINSAPFIVASLSETPQAGNSWQKFLRHAQAELEGKPKGQEGQKKQKALLPFLSFLPFWLPSDRFTKPLAKPFAQVEPL
jgi:hypothetical protein